VIERAKALSLELGTTITPGFEALAFKAARGIEDIYELTYIRKDNSRFPAVVSVTALRDSHENIIGYLLIGTDNTARKQSGRRAAKKRRATTSDFQQRQLFEASPPTPRALSDLHVGAVRMLGYTPAEVIDKSHPGRHFRSAGADERAKA